MSDSVYFRKNFEYFVLEMRALFGYPNIWVCKYSGPFIEDVSGVFRGSRRCRFEPNIPAQVVLDDEHVFIVTFAFSQKQVIEVDNFVRLCRMNGCRQWSGDLISAL